jgi:hypothetical protein
VFGWFGSGGAVVGEDVGGVVMGVGVIVVEQIVAEDGGGGVVAAGVGEGVGGSVAGALENLFESMGLVIGTLTFKISKWDKC